MGERFYSYGPYVIFLHEQYHILTTHIKQNNNSCGMKVQSNQSNELHGDWLNFKAKWAPGFI